LAALFIYFMEGFVFFGLFLLLEIVVQRICRKMSIASSPGELAPLPEKLPSKEMKTEEERLRFFIEDFKKRLGN